MALPMLVNNSECGPSNPLQGLSKRFDQDRGIQQDFFGAGRAGPSRETFRTQQSRTPGLDQDAARFFSSNSPAPQLPTSFGLSALHRSLPSHAPIPQQKQQAAWAADFLQQQPMQTSSPAPQISMTPKSEQMQHQQVQQDVIMMGMQQPGLNGLPQAGMQWNPAMATYRPHLMTGFMPVSTGIQNQALMVQPNQSLWDQEFQSQEILHTAALQPPVYETQTQQNRSLEEADELARTAGLVVESVKDSQNPKFQNSAFMGLMKQLRDGEVVVEGDKMVERGATGWASDFQAGVDIKGKGRAIDPLAMAREGEMSQSQGPRLGNLNLPNIRPAPGSAMMEAAMDASLLMRAATFGQGSQLPGQTEATQEYLEHQEDPNEEYFRQENEEYARASSQSRTAPQANPHWDQLQQQWDSFEATATGIKPIENYQFQSNNPYLIGEQSKPMDNITHDGTQRHHSFSESVLELEAAVQNNPTSASAWYELGVKQQENERESKAIQALLRSIDLDSNHLPTWLALAVSYTNEGKKEGTESAVWEWVQRNKKYESAVQEWKVQNAGMSEGPGATVRFGGLIQCLMAMARSNTTGEIDADIQIALAVLLNANEDYTKSQDCFTTALQVRPDDWLLYNRVGATMANSGHAGDALQYYYRALELNPGYIRARFNLGISCVNLRRYEEAAHHILDALVLQDNDGIPDSSGMNEKRGITSGALWESLKTTCLHMQRIDLAGLCDRQDLEEFRNAFEY